MVGLSSRASSEGPGWAGFHQREVGTPTRPGPSLDARDDFCCGGSMILSFNDPAATHLANSGGKRASLAKLFQGGVNVPPGVIVPASANLEFVAGLPFEELPDHDAQALHAAAAGLRGRRLARPLPHAPQAA